MQNKLTPNMALSFLLEMILLVIYGWVPFGYLQTAAVAIKIGISAVLVAAFIVIWGRFAAPKSDHRLSGAWLILLKAVLFGIGLALFAKKLGLITTIVSALVVAANLWGEYAEMGSHHKSRG